MSKLYFNFPSQEEVWDYPLKGPMHPEDQERARRTLKWFTLIFLALFAVLAMRLWFLQLVTGEELLKKSEHNRLRLQDLPPWRGMILDRRGEVLVANRSSFDLMVFLEDVTDLATLARRLGALFGLDPQQTHALLEGARQAGQQILRIKGDLSWQELSLVETYKAELQGVFIQVQPKREYPHQHLACHVLGYLGEITETQLKSGRFPQAKMGDYVGRCGIEMAWENHLRGQRGFRRIEVDAYGRELGQLDLQPSTPGANVYLTLDLKMQQEAEACLQDKVGAIVALEPHTGRILALASSPSFPQEAFEKGLSAAEWHKLSTHKDHPLENRALKGQYPPGSTFKIVMALAALEEKVITPTSVVYCNGSFPLGNHVFRCWRKGGHGAVNLYKALVQSCDVYFYTVGRKLGIERIAKWSRAFGLGEPTGLKLDTELSGLVASPAWKLARFKAPWQEGDTISVSIGQGYNLVTPLQMAQVVAAVANGGVLYQPQLVERVESPAGEVLYQFQPQIKSRLPASPANLALLQKALAGVVKEGTGRAAKLPHVEVAGKTGTSQVVALEKREGRKKDKKYEHHAWFVAYAPADSPQVALSVIVEHGGGGATGAAPLAQRVLAACLPQTLAAN